MLFHPDKKNGAITRHTAASDIIENVFNIFPSIKYVNLKNQRAWKQRKAQSAMEYLMTYGWALLLIIIVIAILYEIGIFNYAYIEPREPPGSCQVVRPNGPGSTVPIAMEGNCGRALPEWVMGSKGAGDFVIVPGSNEPSSMLNIVGNNITISAWVLIYGSPYHDIIDKEGQYGMKIDYNNYPHACTPSGNTGLCLEWDTSNNWAGNSFPIPGGAFGKWMFLAVTMSGSKKYWYANGVQIGNITVTGSLTYSDANFTIGAISNGFSGYGEAEWFNGTISNVQVYNSTLTPSDIQVLYKEGINGVPIDLQSLVGWWPLDGNANDSSGDNLNGYVYNSYFSNAWINRYPLIGAP